MDMQVVVECAKASQAAYQLGKPEKEFVAGSNRAIIVESPVGRILAFRGTSNRDNFLEDLNAEWEQVRLANGVHCEVHLGFWDSWNRLGILGEKVDWVTGHSLGGGMAIQWALMQAEAQNVVTFGQPRAGDAYFATAASLLPNYVRFVNNKDLVPHLAPEDSGYKHGGQLYWFDDKGRLHNCGSQETPNAVGHFMEAMSLGDHRMIEYLRKIQAIQSEGSST